MSARRRLDRLYRQWETAGRVQSEAAQTLNEATKAAFLAEAAFKGAVEVLGGASWEWDGEHVAIKERDAP